MMYYDGVMLGSQTRSPLNTPLIFCSCSLGPRDLHSFPTRRSSDLSALSALDINSHWVKGIGDRCPATPSTGYAGAIVASSEEHTSELQSLTNIAASHYPENYRPATYTPSARHIAGAIAGDLDGALG